MTEQVRCSVYQLNNLTSLSEQHVLLKGTLTNGDAAHGDTAVATRYTIDCDVNATHRRPESSAKGA